MPFLIFIWKGVASGAQLDYGRINRLGPVGLLNNISSVYGPNGTLCGQLVINGGVSEWTPWVGPN